MPASIITISGSITHQYTFGGEEIKKNGEEVREYLGGVEYKNGAMELINIPDGRILKEGNFQYHLTDHLGNVVVVFEDKDEPGTPGYGTIQIEEEGGDEIIQRNHYYSFGMRVEASGLVNDVSAENKYLYNGKELQSDFDLNWLDYGARYYDPSIAKWNAVDPLAEQFYSWSPYNYTYNNPIRFIDPDGRKADDVIIKGPQAKEAVAALNESSSLTITRDSKTGLLSASGEATTRADKQLLEAINDEKVRVELVTTNETTYDDPKDGTTNTALLPGGYKGSTVENVYSMSTLEDGTPQIKVSEVTAEQLVNVTTAKKVAGIVGENPGETITHEINEAYIGARQDPGGNYSSGYDKAHNTAAGLDRVKHDLDAPNVNPATRTISLRKRGTKKWIPVMKY